MKAKDFLLKLKEAPVMYASNKEAFCATITTALYMDDIPITTPGYGNSMGSFYARHIGHQGSSIVGSNDSFDDKWAQSVIDDAPSMIDAAEKI